MSVNTISLALPSIGYNGQYRCQLINKDLLGKEYISYDSNWFKNIITDIGLNKLGSGPTSFNRYCFIGDSATAASTTDVNLYNQLAGTYIQYPYNPTYTSVFDGTHYRSRTIYYFRFDPDISTRTINEIGVGVPINSNDLSLGANLFSRVNPPSTITQANDQYLDVYYQLDITAPIDDVVIPITLNGTSYLATIRPAYVNNTLYWNSDKVFYLNSYPYNTVAYTADLGIDVITSGPLGTLKIIIFENFITYVQDSFIYKHLFTIGNNHPYPSDTLTIKSFLIRLGNCAFQVELDSPFIHDKTFSMQLNVQASVTRL